MKEEIRAYSWAAPRTRERRTRVWPHFVLFGLTLVTTTMAGALQSGVNPLSDPWKITSGLPFALTLMTIRIIWRFMNDVPSPPDTMPAWQRTVSSLVHWGLYLTVFSQLFAGAMMNGTAGRGIPVFGLFAIPVPVAENHDAHEWWEEVHGFAWRPIAVLLTIHILAALYNHFIAKNDVVRRMTVGVK